MPAAIQAPWDTIKRQFLSGVSMGDLSTAHGINEGTLRKRALREHWRASVPVIQGHIKRATQTAINQAVAQKIQEASPQIDSEVRRWIQTSQKTAGKIVGKIDSALRETVIEPDQLQKLAGALNVADVIGRRAFGLDGSGVVGQVSSGVVGLQVVSENGKTTVQLAMQGNCLPVDYAGVSSPLDVEAQPVMES